MKTQLLFSGFEQKLLVNHQPFFATIFDGEGMPPEGFNVKRICLDLSELSFLHWKEQLLQAQQAISKGLLILWAMEFQLSAGSLEDETRFLTFQLNINHFNEIVWKEFKEHSFGVALFSGVLGPNELDYLRSLAALLDEEALCFLFLDASEAKEIKSYLQQIPLASMGFFCPVIKGKFTESYPWAFPALGWGHSASPLGYCASSIQRQLNTRRLHRALCLPEQEVDEKRLQEMFSSFGTDPFRLIPESLLTQEWEGVDELFIFPETVTERTARKLQGFIAAGGTIHDSPYAPI